MLALSRKQNEAIVVGNDIEITILEIKGDQVKIGTGLPKGTVYADQGCQSGGHQAGRHLGKSEKSTVTGC